MKIFKNNLSDNFYHIVDFYDAAETHGHSYCGYYNPYPRNCITQEIEIEKTKEVIPFNGEQLCPDCVGEAYACGKLSIKERM